MAGTGWRELGPKAYEAMALTLYRSPGTLLAGAFGGAFASGIVASRAHSPWLVAGAALVAAAGLLRIAVFLAFRRFGAGRHEGYGIRPWRILYAAGASLYSACLGLQGLACVGFVDDPVSHMILVSTTVGYVAGIAGRNAGCPEVSLPQLWLAMAPLGAGLLIQGGDGYWLTAGILGLFSLGVTQISLLISSTLYDAHLSSEARAVVAERFATALSTMQHGFALFDAEGRLESCSESLARMLGIARPAEGSAPHLDALIDACIAAGSVPVGSAAVRGTLQGLIRVTEHTTTEFRLRDGRILSLTASPKSGGGCVLLAEDVTERARAASELGRMARYDAVTGLLNRSALDKALQGLLAEGKPVALLALDLDRFKAVNDTHGHGVGDALLRAVAVRLEAAAPEGAMVSRLGGDEFVILLPGTDPRPAAARLARSIVAAVEAPFTVEDRELSVSASVGIAVAPWDAGDAVTLMRVADTALYHVKEAGRCGWRAFDPAMDAEALARQSLEADLRAAAGTAQFEVAYQPQVDLATGRVTAVEALARWRHPVRGAVPPGTFIPLAEETGLINRIGRQILERACRDALAWPAHVRLAVNLSPVQFRRDIAAEVADVLLATGFPGERLELEVTESLFLENGDEARAAFRRLGALGVRFALDDFGTGYSSLSYLRAFPFRKVKVDRSFVQGAEESGDAAVLLGAIANLALDLGKEVVAEGIETPAQMAAVGRLRCTAAQGYHVARPLDARGVAGFLARSHPLEGLRGAA